MVNSVKCQQCGLFNWSLDDQCKRCAAALDKECATSPAPRQRPKRSKDCPSCESSETRSFEMAYASSTSTGSLVASSYNFSGGVTVMGGSINQQSALAAYVVPPRLPQMRYGLTFVAVAVAFVLACMLSGLILHAGFQVFGLLAMFGLPGAAGVATHKYNSTQFMREQHIYNEAAARWRRSWICLRCGHRWSL